jgi:hypothetical protein
MEVNFSFTQSSKKKPLALIPFDAGPPLLSSGFSDLPIKDIQNA